MKAGEALALFGGELPLDSLVAAVNAEQAGDAWEVVRLLRDDAGRAHLRGDDVGAAMLDARASQMAARLRGREP